ncbi:hypothetical protein BDQ17DRAFT_2907 [Cyathus striatus]|nr:hypothetical protein BDQ17DRAFT_2907 [Cyathus striatus]
MSSMFLYPLNYAQDIKLFARYDLSSLAAGETTGNNSVQIIGGSLSGGMMLENCSFIQASGASWDYINHPMLLANESSSLITPGISGILGLGTNRHNGDFNNSGLGVWLSRNPSNSNVSFGLQLNPPTASSRQGGTFDWLVPDQTAYVGDISWRTLAIVSNASINSDWIIELDSWNVSVSERSSTSRSGEMNAIVEPYVPSLIFPYAEAMSIYDRVADANKSGISATSYLWSVPCQTRMSLTVTFGAQSFSINEDYLVQNLNGSCWGSIEGWSDENETLYLLGSAFVSSIYLVASASGVEQGSLGFAKRAEPPRKLEAGTIAGVTLGSVACAILLYLGILQSYKFWRLQHPTYKRLNGPQPFILSQPTASQAPTALMPILPSPTRPKSYALSYVQSPFSGSICLIPLRSILVILQLLPRLLLLSLKDKLIRYSLLK